MWFLFAENGNKMFCNVTIVIHFYEDLTRGKCIEFEEYFVKFAPILFKCRHNFFFKFSNASFTRASKSPVKSVASNQVVRLNVQVAHLHRRCD